MSNYKIKYLKYKSKYLQLKNQFGGEDEYIEIMCQLMNEGIDTDVARYSSVYTEELRSIMLYLFHILFFKASKKSA